MSKFSNVGTTLSASRVSTLKSRFLAVGAAATLVLTVAPATFATAPGFDCYTGGADVYTTQNGVAATPSCGTTITIKVDLGSTLFVPASISINGGTSYDPIASPLVGGGTIASVGVANTVGFFPGQTVKSLDQNMYYYSNESNKNVKATLTNLVGTNSANVIAAGDVSLSNDAAATWEPMGSSPVVVSDIPDRVGATDESATLQAFSLKVFIPSAAADTYTATMTWTVQ